HYERRVRCDDLRHNSGARHWEARLLLETPADEGVPFARASRQCVHIQQHGPDAEIRQDQRDWPAGRLASDRYPDQGMKAGYQRLDVTDVGLDRRGLEEACRQV